MASWDEPAVGNVFSSHSNLPHLVSHNFLQNTVILRKWKKYAAAYVDILLCDEQWLVFAFFLFSFTSCWHVCIELYMSILNSQTKLIASWKRLLCNSLQGFCKQIAVFSIFNHLRSCRSYQTELGLSVFQSVQKEDSVILLRHFSAFP